MLIDALLEHGVQGKDLLDIGGGVGALQHHLLANGLQRVVSVDASADYLEAAKREGANMGHADRIEQHFGDFVELAEKISKADIVTLDKVICCYHDLKTLLDLSAARSKQIYGIVYPIDTWWTKTLLIFENFSYWIRRNPFRAFIYSTEEVNLLLMANGLKQVFHFQKGYWQVALYSR